MGSGVSRAATLRAGLLLTVYACGASSTESTTADGAASTLRVAAPAPGANAYSSTPTDEAVRGAAGKDAVERGILRAAEAARYDVRGDGRLAQLASWTAANLGEGGTPPPREVVEFFAHHLGLIEPIPHLLVLGQPDPAALEDGVADSVSQFMARQRYNFYGAAVIENEGLTIAVVMLAWRYAEIGAVPRTLATGAPIAVSGRLLETYIHPSFAVAPPTGAVQRVPAGNGPEFQVNLPTAAPGAYRVELLAHGPRGDTVVANFPVYVGVEPPTEVVVRPRTSGGEAPGSVDDVGEALFALLNGTRQDNGLPPLARHEGLGDVALRHSRDMVENGFVGHTSPTTGGAPDRVTRAGYRSGLVLENIGRGYSAAEIHEGLLQSPGHRANLLNADVSHVGIGVMSEREGDRSAYIATQVFIRMNRAIDTSGAPEILLGLINQGRAARRADLLSAHENLSEAAQTAAESFFENPEQTQQDTVDAASASLRRFAIQFSRVGGLMSVVSDIEEAGQLEPTFDPEVRFVGIGVAQGNRPDAPPNSIAVVIMLGWPR